MQLCFKGHNQSSTVPAAVGQGRSGLRSGGSPSGKERAAGGWTSAVTLPPPPSGTVCRDDGKQVASRAVRGGRLAVWQAEPTPRRRACFPGSRGRFCCSGHSAVAAGGKVNQSVASVRRPSFEEKKSKARHFAVLYFAVLVSRVTNSVIVLTTMSHFMCLAL